jgi:hypothetical protein
VYKAVTIPPFYPGLYREFESGDGLKHAILVAYHAMVYVLIYEVLKIKQPFNQGIEVIIGCFILNWGAPN